MTDQIKKATSLLDAMDEKLRTAAAGLDLRYPAGESTTALTQLTDAAIRLAMARATISADFSSLTEHTYREARAVRVESDE